MGTKCKGLKSDCFVFLVLVALKEYKRVYENILAVEKKLDLARKHLVSGGGGKKC